MNKQILKSDSSFVLAGKSPAWKALNNVETGNLFALVQNVSFDFSSNRQSLRQIGNQKYSIYDNNRFPDINLNIDYYFSPYLNNEILLGFNGSGSVSTNALSNLKDFNNNFYVFNNKTENQDAFSQRLNTWWFDINYIGYDIISFGNCYLSNYSVSFKYDQLPIASVKLKSSNIKADLITGGNSPSFYIDMPCLDPVSGSMYSNTSYIDQPFYLHPPYINYTGKITGDLLGRTAYNAPVTNPAKSTFTLYDKRQDNNSELIPFRSLSGVILQSLDLSMDFNRVDLHRLGNNSVSDRKLQYPIIADIKIESLISGFAFKSNSIGYSVFNNKASLYAENFYDFDLSFSDSQRIVTGFYKFKNAKLNNWNYSLPINNIYKFTASFSVQITDSTGFLMSRIQK